MGRIYRALIAAFAVLFGLGLALTSASVASAGEDAKREDDVREVATVEYDDDDDNTNTGLNTNNTGDNTVNSNDRTGDSNDGTNSRKTGVSRDKDRSRGDLTKDWTRDGAGDRTRDWSQNRTNDKSRNDTR
jgi:hypothetical protein